MAGRGLTKWCFRDTVLTRTLLRIQVIGYPAR